MINAITANKIAREAKDAALANCQDAIREIESKIKADAGMGHTCLQDTKEAISILQQLTDAQLRAISSHIRESGYLLHIANNRSGLVDSLMISWESVGEPSASAMEYLSEVMGDDSDYAWSWHCNLATLAINAGADRIPAHEHAATFMKVNFGVDVGVMSRFIDLMNSLKPQEDSALDQAVECAD